MEESFSPRMDTRWTVTTPSTDTFIPHRSRKEASGKGGSAELVLGRCQLQTEFV